MMRRNSLLRVSGLIFMLLFSVMGYGLKPDDVPVRIESDRAQFDQINGVAVYHGHVVVDQGFRRLLADKLVIERDNNNQIKVMIATGSPARFRSQEDPNRPEGSGKAKTIKYYPGLDKVDLINDAQLTQNGDTISGPFLTYDFSKEILKSKSSKKQRSTVIIHPKRGS
jgi:lipopolysaccharide export system protein LptA